MGHQKCFEIQEQYNLLHLERANLPLWDGIGNECPGSSSAGRAGGTVEGSEMNRGQQCSPAVWQEIAASYGDVTEKMELGSSQWSIVGEQETIGVS